MYYLNSCKLRTLIIIIIIKLYGTRFFFEYIVIVINMYAKNENRVIEKLLIAGPPRHGRCHCHVKVLTSTINHAIVKYYTI